METVRLNNGFSIPAIGFGTYPQKETLEDSARIAYDAGYRLFDCSDNYHNEEFLGKAAGPDGSRMDGAAILTKFSQPYRTDRFSRCFDESAEKLGGRIDLYLLHWPYPFLWKEQWRRMEELYRAGKCKGIGVCNFEADKLKELLSFCKVRPVINQIERHPLFQQQEIVDFCRRNDILVMSYSPVARHDKDLFESAVLRRLAEKYGKTPGQIILRWNVDTGTVPIPGSGSEAHIRENIDIFDFALTADEIGEINSLECGKRIRFDPKKRFTLKQKAQFAVNRIRLRKT